MRSFTNDTYETILEKIKLVEKLLLIKQKQNREVFLDNQEFIQIMNISKRNAQTWRDEGIIGFSKIGNKIYYKMKDVNDLIERYYVKAKS